MHLCTRYFISTSLNGNKTRKQARNRGTKKDTQWGMHVDVEKLLFMARYTQMIHSTYSDTQSKKRWDNNLYFMTQYGQITHITVDKQVCKVNSRGRLMPGPSCRSQAITKTRLHFPQKSNENASCIKLCISPRCLFIIAVNLVNAQTRHWK